jgi:hypothetical protein
MLPLTNQMLLIDLVHILSDLQPSSSGPEDRSPVAGHLTSSPGGDLHSTSPISSPSPPPPPVKARHVAGFTLFVFLFSRYFHSFYLILATFQVSAPPPALF